MAQRSTVPKFGNWESEEIVPYTVYFDNARKGKSGRQTSNPNDSQDNPNLHSRNTPSVRAPPFRTRVQSKAAVGETVVRPRDEHLSSKEDFNINQSTGSPLCHDTVDRKTTTASPYQWHGERGLSFGDPPKRVGRVGADRSFEQSPLHPQYQTKAGGRGSGTVSSTVPERKLSEGSHGGLAPNTPGRSRMRSANDETPVPKFGEWDETNPASADRFTHIFNKVRQEKQGGSGSAEIPVMDTSNSTSQKHVKTKDSVVCSCFSWCRK